MTFQPERVTGTTKEHPFYVHGKGWTPLREIRPGDLLGTAKDVYATGNRGLAFAAQKKYPQAFEAALALNTPTYSAYEYAGFLASCPERKYRDGKQAVELAKKSLEILGKNARWEAHAALAAAYAEGGDFELAVTSRRTALEDKTCTGGDRKAQDKRLELYRAKKPYRAE